MSNKWAEYYKSRVITHEEAAQKIQSNDGIMMSVGATASTTKMYEEILKHCINLENIFVNECIVFVPSQFMFRDFNIKYYNQIKGGTGYAIGPARELFKEKLRDILVSQVHDSAEYMAYNTDVWYATVTPPDHNGYVNLSLTDFCHSDGIRMGRKIGRARTVIAEVNDQLPVVFGDSYMHVSEFDYFVEISQPPLLYDPDLTAPSEDIVSMGNYVADLVKDGDTIQIGIGPISETAASLLDKKRDLGIYTEMLATAHLDLIEKGVVTNSKKTFFNGKTVTCFILGNQRLYDYCRENPACQIMSGAAMANPLNIAKNPNMVTINNTLLMDITGASTCEAIGHRQVSGVGGQLAFTMGAMLSDGGRAIQIIKAANRGSDGNLHSSILPELPLGTNTSVTRNWIDNVVSEYGVASMRNKSARQRADALIAIAHPDFRGELRKAARRNLYPSFDQEIK